VDVGERLKRARVEQGLYVPELVYRTHIRAGLIEDIERGDFSNCGGDVYARGHVRALAAALGLDPLPLLKAMGGEEIAAHADAVAAPEAPTSSIWELDKRAVPLSEHRTRWLLSVVAIVIVGVLVWQARARNSAVVLDNAVDSVSQSASASPSASATPSATPTTSASPVVSTPVAAGTIAIRLDCSATSWVRISNASGTLYEGTMHNGDSRTVTSPSDVNVRVGNAAGIALTVNDAQMASLGASGQVYDHTFTVG
jgi:cytoskeletal protein RodZ